MNDDRLAPLCAEFLAPAREMLRPSPHRRLASSASRRGPVQCAALVLLLFSVACARREETPADTIFFNGAVVTMEADQPQARALAVLDGKIVAVGSRRQAMRWKGPDTVLHDLAGRALLPGFIDAHGHISLLAQTIALCNVSAPPVGPVSNLADLKRELLAYRDRMKLPPGAWIVGFGYDDSLLEEARHPNRDDLDAISAGHPIALIHVSAHLASLNSAALAAVGLTEATPDPAGGVIRRREGSRDPDGVLEESALLLALRKFPEPSEERRLALLDLALLECARFGITTVQDGFTQPADLVLLQRAAADHRLLMDVVAYPAWFAAAAMMKNAEPGRYAGRLRLGGVKLILDGSPQGKTAWLTQPYLIPPPGKEADYCGYPAMTDAQIDAVLNQAFSGAWQVLAHCNGDAAGDQLLAAVERASRAHPGKDRRTVMIHAQTVRDDQLDRMAPLSVMPSYFAAHPYYWGDWHRDSVLGPERAARISPARSTIDRGLPFTLHNDAPVVPPDMMRLVAIAVNRRTRSGRVLGPEQSLTPGEALRAITLDAAYQYFEEHTKGSLRVGKLANLAILARNPLTPDSGPLADIPVVETWVEGRRVWPATPEPSALPQ